MCVGVVKCVRCGGASGCVRVSLFSGSMLCSIIMHFFLMHVVGDGLGMFLDTFHWSLGGRIVVMLFLMLFFIKCVGFFHGHDFLCSIDCHMMAFLVVTK